jgi:ribonuclease P protein component
MLSKSRRVPRELFKTIFKDKKSRLIHLHSDHFSLAVKEALNTPARAGVSVSKKVSKSAVVRNKVRRRTYSTLRDIVGTLKRGIYLVSAKKGADKLTFEKLSEEIGTLVLKFHREK